ncbi:DUF7344 domain-containing protein [Haloarchaeobius sp. DFWS5]|uniref:DUF7344 domain-containing protein n=1 Tax=Haloarchaeobius sp. DFWS5 TaxID=3446114 RepID=UPI003EBD559A
MSESDSPPASSAADAAGAPSSLARGDVYELLTNARRRAAVDILRESDGSLELGTLAERVAAAEEGTTVDELGSNERQRVYISLYQSHVPALVDADVVEYDKDSGVITPGPHAHVLYRYLDMGAEATANAGRRWAFYHALAAAVGLVFLTLNALQLTATSPLVLHAGTVAASLFAVVGHVLDRAGVLFSTAS